MAYVALRQQPGPNGGVRRPGDHMPEADAWPNPKLWVSRGYVRWVSDADVVDGRWRGFEEFARSGAGGRALQALVAAGVTAPTAPKDERPVRRLPLLEEYVRAGYAADAYEGFLTREKARLDAAGFRVEVRGPTPEEAAQIEAALREHEEAKRREATLSRPPAPPAEALAAEPPAEQPRAAEMDATPATPVAMPAHPAALPSRKELEAMSQPQLVALAEARGLPVDSGAGKGKLLKLLSK